MITYAITVCTEYNEIKKLIPYLLDNKDPNDEIVVLYDNKNGDVKVWEFLQTHKNIKSHQIEFDFNFSNLKNTLNSYCTQDYIFNIDADELPNLDFIKNIHNIIKNNPEVEMFWVPRINTVEGITMEHIKKYGWVIGKIPNFTTYKKVSKEEYFLLKTYNLITSGLEDTIEYYIPIINPFEYQSRIFKNSNEIKWEGKVHEKIVGYKKQTFLPQQEKYSLYHFKHINKQIQQNDLYDKIIKNGTIR